MLSFVKKYFFLLLILSLLIMAIVALEPILSKLFSLNTAPPIKIYKVTQVDERETNKLQKRSSNKSTENDTSLHVEQSSLSDNGTPKTPEVFNEEASDEVQNEINHNDTHDHNHDEALLKKRPPKNGITKAVAAEQARKKRLAEVESEMRALAPHTGQGNHAITLRMLDLEEEMFTILKEQGRLKTHGVNPFIEIKMMRLVFSSMTNGKVPVYIGEQVASYLEEEGHYEHAARHRAITQRAIEKGDEFFKFEHLEDK